LKYFGTRTNMAGENYFGGIIKAYDESIVDTETSIL
jgi:hypothetical protein